MRNEWLRNVLGRREACPKASRNNTRMGWQNCLHRRDVDVLCPLCSWEKVHFKPCTRENSIWHCLVSYGVSGKLIASAILSQNESVFSLRILRKEWFFDNWTPCGVGQVETVHRGFKEMKAVSTAQKLFWQWWEETSFWPFK